MITIGGKPIIWHIMKQYSHYGVNEFIICLGYKGYVVKEYFANYFLHMSDVTFDMANNEMQVHEKHVEPWKITLIETGEDTQTGGRLKKVRDYIGNETFCFTYGDGVSNINIQKLIEFHQSHGKLATVTAIQPPGRYGALNLNSERVEQFQEKPAGDGSWINGGFFVLEPEVMDFIEGPTTAWEESPLKKLADQQALMAYRHTGFWKAMDTLRDKVSLENLWQTTAPWKVWE